MKKIIFKQVLPHVFSESGDVLDSEVWKKDVTLERGQVYLIEAASGTGKSSFCSYLYGRSRYKTVVRFPVDRPSTMFVEPSFSGTSTFP